MKVDLRIGHRLARPLPESQSKGQDDEPKRHGPIAGELPHRGAEASDRVSQRLKVRLPAVSGGAEATARGRLGGFTLRLAGIVAAGVVLRVLYTVLVAPWPPGLPDDQVYFQLMPDLLADGHGFTQPLLATRGEYVPTAAHPPLYSVVLAGPAELGRRRANWPCA